MRGANKAMKGGIPPLSAIAWCPRSQVRGQEYPGLYLDKDTLLKDNQAQLSLRLGPFPHLVWARASTGR